MTNGLPELTDRQALLRNRDRAAKNGDHAMFLHQIAIDEIKERLLLVNKPFTKPAIVTGFPEFWGRAFPGFTVVQDTDSVELDPNVHDLVIHAMSLHWANDPVGQIVQCRHALMQDGLFLGCLFGGQTLNELRTSLAEAEAAICGGMSPHVVPMAEIRDLGGLLQRAGLALPVADAVTQTVTYAGLTSLLSDLRAMGEGNALKLRASRPLPRAVYTLAERIYQSNFSATDATLSATFEMIFLSGWAPHPDQPKPLRPGSASHSLAQTLEQLKSGTNN